MDIQLNTHFTAINIQAALIPHQIPDGRTVYQIRIGLVFVTITIIIGAKIA